MIVPGREDQNNLEERINKGESSTMENSNIQKLMEEVETYKQAIQDAKDALASAEMELDDALENEFHK